MNERIKSDMSYCHEGESRKIYYISRRLDINDKKRVGFIMDYECIYDFNSYVHEFLLNPNTEDKLVLAVVPGCGYIKDLFNKFIREYINKFKEINNIFIRNHSYPPFPHPEDITESETIRYELVKIYPEEELNKFYGVENRWDYEPPYYEG